MEISLVQFFFKLGSTDHIADFTWLLGVLQKDNRELEREVRQLKHKLSMSDVSVASPRSRSSSPPSHRQHHSRTSSSRYAGDPMTEYEKDRRALTRAWVFGSCLQTACSRHEFCRKQWRNLLESKLGPLSWPYWAYCESKSHIQCCDKLTQIALANLVISGEWACDV